MARRMRNSTKRHSCFLPPFFLRSNQLSRFIFIHEASAFFFLPRYMFTKLIACLYTCFIWMYESCRRYIAFILLLLLLLLWSKRKSRLHDLWIFHVYIANRFSCRSEWDIYQSLSRQPKSMRTTSSTTTDRRNGGKCVVCLFSASSFLNPHFILRVWRQFVRRTAHWEREKWFIRWNRKGKWVRTNVLNALHGIKCVFQLKYTHIFPRWCGMGCCSHILSSKLMKNLKFRPGI